MLVAASAQFPEKGSSYKYRFGNHQLFIPFYLKKSLSDMYKLCIFVEYYVMFHYMYITVIYKQGKYISFKHFTFLYSESLQNLIFHFGFTREIHSTLTSSIFTNSLTQTMCIKRWALFAWSILFHLFKLNLFMFLQENCISCNHTVGS